ncbi:substrate-binding protein [Rhodovibrionaceae bacterium A322]
MFKSLGRREFIGTAVAGAAVAALPSRLLAAEAIKIGAVLPFSGGLELFGNQAKMGMDLAAAEINAAGGILGRPVEIIYEDNKTDPKTSVERANKLARGDKALAVVGPITSNARDAMAPALRKARTPLLYATNYEGGACDRYLFAFNTVPNQELAKLVPALMESSGDSFYCFGANYVWPQKMFEAADGLVTSLGGKMVGTEFTKWGETDFKPVIDRIKASGAKNLLFALPGADGITFIKQAEEFGLMDQVTIGFLGFAETYLGAFGEGKGQNMWVTVPFAASLQEPGVQDFVSKIRASAGDGAPISHYVMTHYNAVMATKAALEKSGKVDREALVDGLEGLTMDSPTGPLSIGAADHHVTFNMFLAKTEGNGLKVVKSLGEIAPEAGCK